MFHTFESLFNVWQQSRQLAGWILIFGFSVNLYNTLLRLKDLKKIHSHTDEQLKKTTGMFQ